jgi:hypothetical protein
MKLIKDISIDNSSLDNFYFQRKQSIYNRKQIALVPIENYSKANNLANNNFYTACTFEFGNGKSFCTDYVHDVFRYVGLNFLPVISDVMEDQEGAMKAWIIGHGFATNFMNYYSSEYSKMKDFPLPINFAKQVQKKFLNYN